MVVQKFIGENRQTRIETIEDCPLASL